MRCPIKKRSRAQTVLLLLALGAGLAGGPTSSVLADKNGSPPPEVRKALLAAVNAGAKQIRSEKNEEGRRFKRCAFSHKFSKIDDSTYQGVLHVDTAFKDKLVTQRFRITLKPDDGQGWAITDKLLEDTYEGLYRTTGDDRECARFDAFSISREGLDVKAGGGSLCKSFLHGRLSGIALAGDALTYDYEPPVKKDEMPFGLLRKERGKDVLFTPEYVSIRCDPVSCKDILSSAFTGLTAVPFEQIDPGLRKPYEEGADRRRKKIADNPFWGFRRFLEPERRYYSVSIKKKGSSDHWFSLVHDSADGREVSVWVSGFFGPIYRYYAEETRASGVSPHDLELRPDAEARDYDLVSLEGTVELGFGDGETLTGDITYGMKAKRALRELPFGIARIFQTAEKKETKNPKMIINSIQDGQRNELTWVRTGLYSGLVILPATVPEGALFTLRLDFENKDSIYKLTPTFSYVDRGGWLPFVRFADMIDKFDLTVKVPARYKSLGIGRKVSESRKDGVATSRWVADKPVSFPTVIYGTYYEAKSGFKAKKADGTEIPVTIHFDKDSMASFEIVPRALKKFANDAANALNLYREIFGIDYPYAKLDLVNDPLGLFYGQSPSSLIYLGSGSFWSTGFTAGLLEGGSDLSKFQDSLVAHEVAHQWWGSLVSNANDRNYWFIESLAEYSAALFVENVYGPKAYREHVESWRKKILRNDMRSSVQDGYTVWAGPGRGNYRAALYAKGPYAFHIMRSTWGDEAFFKFLKNMAHDLAGRQIVTRDIQREAEKTFGANLDWFFDQWLRGVGLPELSFEYTVRRAEGGKQLVEGVIHQRILLRAALDTKEVIEGKYFTGIVPITVVGKSGTQYRKKVIIKGPATPFKFHLPEKPKEIILNRYGEMLSYDVVVNASN